MKVKIQPSTLVGSIQTNASKSSMQRACAAALLAGGTSVIKNPGNSNDDQAALDIIQKLGALIESKGNEIIITSNGVHPIGSEINCGESGLSIRMFTPLVALSIHAITVNGTGSLTTRPMDFFDEILPQLGIKVKSNSGKLPLSIQGPLVPKTIQIDGSLSSQFLTGLLMAFSAANATDVSIKVNNLKSRPYIDLTLHVMKQFGLKIPENRNYEEFYFAPTHHSPLATEVLTKAALTTHDSRLTTHHSPLTTHHYTVEGDWSGAAFLLVAGAIAGNITVKGLDVFSTQADKAVLQALIDTGCKLSIQPEQIEIGLAPLKPFHFNATECPDLFPPLVALAAACNGKSVIEGTKRLVHKESNRAITLQDEFKKLGIQIDLQDDLMIVHGGTVIQSAVVHSRHDHRIAMACAVAALKANGEVKIEAAEAINKSYPDFYEHLKLLGANVSL